MKRKFKLPHIALPLMFAALGLMGCSEIDGEGGRDNALAAPEDFGPEYSEAELTKKAADLAQENASNDVSGIVSETVVFRGEQSTLSDEAKSAIQNIAQQVADDENTNVFIRVVDPNDVTSDALGETTKARIEEVKDALKGEGVDVANYTLNRYSSRDYHSLQNSDLQQSGTEYGLSKQDVPGSATDGEGASIVLTIVELNDL